MRTLASLFFVLIFAALLEARAENVSREYPLKAVFLLNFARFTQWPSNAFKSADSPFVIGILGENPFGPLLQETVQGEQLDGRKFVVQYYPGMADLKKCDMLFISQSENGHLGKIIDAMRTKPVLTVAEGRNAAEDGVCVQFITSNNKIHLRINLNALNSAHLTMSSELLRLAEVIPPK